MSEATSAYLNEPLRSKERAALDIAVKALWELVGLESADGVVRLIVMKALHDIETLVPGAWRVTGEALRARATTLIAQLDAEGVTGAGQVVIFGDAMMRASLRGTAKE